MVEWAAALLAHNLCLRGGELGTTNKDEFDPARGITWSSFDWKGPCRESDYCHWVVVDVVAIKDTNRRHRVVPMVVRRRQRDGELGGDPICTYDALLRVWHAGRAEGGPGKHNGYRGGSTVAFFTGAAGRPWRTHDSKLLAQRIAAFLGHEAEDFGGKAFRIGGTTDIAAALGERGRALLKERGRWASDTAYVYARALASSHLEASALVGDADGRELEAMLAGWAQPATFR